MTQSLSANLTIARVYLDRAAYLAWERCDFRLENSLRLMAEEVGWIHAEVTAHPWRVASLD